MTGKDNDRHSARLLSEIEESAPRSRSRQSGGGTNADKEINARAGSDTGIRSHTRADSDTEVRSNARAGSDAGIRSNARAGSDAGIRSNTRAGSKAFFKPNANADANADASGAAADGGAGDVEKQYRAAKKTALNILAYRDNTALSLRRKLRERGYSAELTDEVISEMKALGYLNEERMIITAALYMAQVKLYGKRRIFAELRAKGYSRQSVSELDFSKGELADIDFAENRRRLIEKRGGELTPTVRAFLARYGY